MNITIGEVFEALSKNNQNTGGSYIEKAKNAYYIRSEGMISRTKDIEQIVVANRNGIPVHISDVGIVRFGAPKRFGAMTKDGKGECVGGIAMMLKGANANVVTQELEKRVEKIQKLLPEGVSIEPYLNRSELVNRNISTVVHNLIEGAIIVFVVLIIFLGNIRAGLIVASVIPLAMLFAFILMRIFGVTANLMSLGALDFGIIVDGAVVIVENAIRRLAHAQAHHGRQLTRAERFHEVFAASREARRALVFGQIIIMVVYLPIFALTGVEGKMFHPMAFTVVTALLGAMILSVTFVPAAIALFITGKVKEEENFVMRRARLAYEPALRWVLGHRALVVGGAVDHRRESADAEERPADPPQSAQQHPGQETAGQAVAGGAQHADDDRQEQAGLQCQVLVQAADQRIEGQADQAVDRQQHADLPERLQADLVPVDRQGDIKHRIAGQA